MVPASHATNPVELAAPVEGSAYEAVHSASVIHAPSPGLTASLINDFRELFKVRVTGMVVITGWAGFYLGSMQSGISTLQRGLVDTLFGIGLISAGSGALNQALERKSDALMARPVDRPLAAGRMSLASGVL